MIKESCELQLKPTENMVILKYDPQRMLAPYDVDSVNKESYEFGLEDIKNKIDWCIRKSAGQEPDTREYF